MKDKFIRKYMNIAKVVGECENPCFSRKIGSVIVNPETNSIVGTGYNSPPKGVPHCDSEWHIKNIVWDNISRIEKSLILGLHPLSFEEFLDIKRCISSHLFNTKDCEKLKIEFGQIAEKDTLKEKICKTDFYKNKCPRRLLNIPSGERTELCTCEHSERNAIYNSQTSTQNCYIFCYCCLPCMDCSKAIINSRIKRIYCLSVEGEDYSPQSPQSRPMLNVADVEIIEHSSKYYGV